MARGRRTGRRGRPRRKGRPLLWIVVGGAVSVVGVIVLLTLPAVYADRAAYRRAQPCQGSTSGCVRVLPAVVEGTDVDRRKSDEYEVLLRVEDTPAAERVELPVPDVVFPALTTGREVTVWIWDGDITRIDVPGAGSAETEHSPLVVAVELPLFGLALAVWGAFGAWRGVALRRGEDESALRLPGRRAALGRVLVAGMAATLAGFFQVVAFDVYVGWAYALTTALVWLAAWALLRRGLARAGADAARG